MALGRDYDKACPIFNFSTKDAGVIFPFTLTNVTTGTTETNRIDLSGADNSTILVSAGKPMQTVITPVVASV